MTKRTKKSNIIVAGIAGGILCLAGVATAAPSAEQSVTNTEQGQTRTQLVHTTATVTGMNHSARTLSLKTSDGEETTIKVPQAVKQFDQLAVGDKVDVGYYQALAISMAPSGAKPSMSERRGHAVDVGGGVRGREMSVSAEVTDVNPAANTVTFKGPKGGIHTVHVEDPSLQAKLPSLKPGQVVQFDYTQAVAASIQPIAK